MSERMFAFRSDGTPRPALGLADEAGPDRVRKDVLQGRAEMLLAVDHPGREPLGEERTAPAVPCVVLAGVVTLKPLERWGQTLHRTIDDSVIVGSHQAVRVKSQIPSADGAPQQDQECTPVFVVTEERSRMHGPRREMEVPVRKLGTENAGHASRLRPS